MTQEEKARRYDEAIEISKKWRNAPNVNKIPTFANRVIEEIFPELKESEDERIRKELIVWLKNSEGQTLPIDRYNAALAWLEKQGEQKPQRMISAEAKEAMYAQPAWSEEDEFELECVLGHLRNYLHEDSYIHYEDWLKSLKDRVQPQPNQEWSEEDEKIAKTIINEFEQSSEWYCANGLTKEDCIAWVNKQMHTKWSEEDKKKVNNLYVLLDQMVSFNMLSNKDTTEFKDWLKSLKQRIGG